LGEFRLSKYRLPNGLILNLDDETGATTVVGGGGRTVAPGARVTDDGILGKAPTGDEPRAVSRSSSQEKNQTDDELGISSPLQVPQGRTAPAVDSGSQPLAALRPTPDEPGLVKEDPIGDTLIGGAAAKPVGALVGKAVGAVTSKVAPVVGRIIQPSLRGAAEGAAVAGVPTLLHTGDPLAALKAAGEGAVTGGVLGHAAHSMSGIVGKALREKAAMATEEAAHATAAAEAAEASHPAMSPTVQEHLTTLAGSAGPEGVAALKAVALSPTLATLHAAVKAGVPAYIALQVAKLGQGVAR
jgi:hypothetical protein